MAQGIRFLTQMRNFISYALLALLACSCARESDSLEYALERQMRTYPQSCLQDIYKSYYQDFFGSEHMISDTASVRAYLRQEIEMTKHDSVLNPYYDPTGSEGNYVRIYLRCVIDSIIDEDDLLTYFLEASQHREPQNITWEQRWAEVMNAVARIKSQPEQWTQDSAMLNEYSRHNYAVRHSQLYRDTYHPHYRIIRRETFEKKLRDKME
ncbi:MAG TPA: hypothetical protein DEO38_05415 [Bacteroidales bacterium]|nr:hypothetical protein [Bacteroidales bacterium]